MRTYTLIGIYLAAIIAANLSVALLGPSISIANALVFIGLDLVAGDRLHEAWRGRGLLLKTAALIGAGGALSYALNADSGPIALASCVAFACAAAIDRLIYHLLRERAYLVRVNGSNVVSAAADSLIFPLLAFGWPPLWWIVIGQFVAKTGGGWLWSLALKPRWAGRATPTMRALKRSGVPARVLNVALDEAIRRVEAERAHAQATAHDSAPTCARCGATLNNVAPGRSGH